MNCPKCDEEMQQQECEPDVGIMEGGWFCTACDVWMGDSETDNEPEIDR